MNLYQVKEESYASVHLDGECYKITYVVAPSLEAVARKYPNAAIITIIQKEIKILS
ncbi:hypothetical protein [Riemerella anatipestifer]|uniref:hypothetical protein n=1 Tax=Riemerella anatipestifer TaxID=34085 RepID=UPI000A71D3B3|nr:hypothetical protein [Riemerella anatipestifer]